MGYNTDLTGELKFTKELTIAELKELNTFFGEDPNNHPEWIKPDGKNSYIQWELTKEMDGITWDGGEKFYYIPESVNLILANMQAKFPEFGLEGSIQAQGEDFADRWVLTIKDGKAVKVDVPMPTDIITCPHCEENFSISEAQDNA